MAAADVAECRVSVDWPKGPTGAFSFNVVFTRRCQGETARASAVRDQGEAVLDRHVGWVVCVEGRGRLLLDGVVIRVCPKFLGRFARFVGFQILSNVYFAGPVGRLRGLQSLVASVAVVRLRGMVCWWVCEPAFGIGDWKLFQFCLLRFFGRAVYICPRFPTDVDRKGVSVATGVGAVLVRSLYVVGAVNCGLSGHR